MRYVGAFASAPRSAAHTIGAPGQDCHPPRPEGAEESVRTAPPLLPIASIAVASCHSPGPGGVRTAGDVPAVSWAGAATPARSGGVRDVGRRRVAPTPWAVMVRGEMPGGGCHPRPGDRRGVRNEHLHGCHRARAELMGHAPGRCGICRLVEPLGLVHVPNGLRNPQGPVTRWGDERWQLIVRWVLNAQIAAEAFGITSKNVDEMKAKSTSAEVRRILGAEGKFGDMMGLSNDWAYNIVKQVGNYGESYERTVGMGSPLKLKRGANELWTKGGLLYTPPFQ